MNYSILSRRKVVSIKNELFLIDALFFFQVEKKETNVTTEKKEEVGTHVVPKDEKIEEIVGEKVVLKHNQK